MTEPTGQFRYEFTARPAQSPGEPVWVWVRGGDLSMPVQLQISPSADGRYIVTGLIIGGDGEPEEITSQTLREIKLREILTDLFAALDFPRAIGLTDESATHATVRSRNTPEEATLRDFARTYQAELAVQPQRAMTAAAKVHNISRATANRWAEQCRRLGYLPEKNAEPDLTSAEKLAAFLAQIPMEPINDGH